MNNHQHQISLLQQIHNHSQFDDVLQMLSSASPWVDNLITHGAATPMMLHLLSRTHDAAFSLPQGDHNDVVHVPSFNPHALQEGDASIKAIFNGFTGALSQTPNQPQQLHHSQTENVGVSAAVPAVSPPSTAGQPRQRVRARRGQATDPHSIAERLRRERIAERMKALQELVPNANRTDKASMFDEIIDYVKFLQIQVKVLSTSRLGGVAPLLGEISSQGKKDDGDAESERAVAKLMEEDMGSAMQYLQGKGLCLMPISLATSTYFFIFIILTYIISLSLFKPVKFHFTWIYMIIPRPSQTHTHTRNKQYRSICKYIQLACSTQTPHVTIRVEIKCLVHAPHKVWIL